MELWVLMTGVQILDCRPRIGRGQFSKAGIQVCRRARLLKGLHDLTHMALNVLNFERPSRVRGQRVLVLKNVCTPRPASFISPGQDRSSGTRYTPPALSLGSEWTNEFAIYHAHWTRTALRSRRKR